MDVGFGGAEELDANVVEIDLGVADLPVARRDGLDRGPEKATKELVAEADAAEVEIGSSRPELCTSALYQAPTVGRLTL